MNNVMAILIVIKHRIFTLFRTAPLFFFFLGGYALDTVKTIITCCLLCPLSRWASHTLVKIVPVVQSKNDTSVREHLSLVVFEARICHRNASLQYKWIGDSED